MKLIKTLIKFYLLFICLFFFLPSHAEERSTIFKGYITNKIFKPINLKVYSIDKKSLYTTERNLEDNSYVPILNLRVTAENTFDYSLAVDDESIFIPKATKFSGYISDIQPPKAFDKKGYLKITFDKVICPDGKLLYLEPNLSSSSQAKVYSPLRHAGKATLGLLGGSLAGAFFTYQLGGLGLALATHGYSLAAGAAAGGFVGVVGGLASKGKKTSIEPGDELSIMPIDEVSVHELKQVTCNQRPIIITEESDSNKTIDIELISIKQKREMLGEAAIKLKVKVKNNSDEKFRLNNFFLRDSQGKEYTTTFTDMDTDMFIDFPPYETKVAKLDFLVEHPKASHWLVLKDKNYARALGTWKVK